MEKSNINIISNIYVRSEDDVTHDKKYVEHIFGAERLKNLKNSLSSLSTVKLNNVQDRIVKESSICANIKNGERSFGPVLTNEGIVYSCRCEKKDCDRYDGYGGCMDSDYAKCIDRKPVEKIHNDDEDQEDLKKFIKRIGVVFNENENGLIIDINRNNKNETPTEESDREYEKPKEPIFEEKQESEYKQIENSDCIISSPIDSHIILNSGPGTGKTYTIIQRLIYILKNNLCNADEINILCYTRSAKNVIETKINEAVKNGILLPSAKNICVLTFDSYATYFLIDTEDISSDYQKMDYNQRISSFNEKINSESLENIKYFIVDEIQDLVNERAEMVLKILNCISCSCGYLIAGDKCQSIYDYAADGDVKIDSVEFYNQLNKQFPEDIQKYEISVNHRQSGSLDNQANEMRRVLLEKPIKKQNEYVGNTLKKYLKSTIKQYIKNYSDKMTEVPTAILCRGNGEAEYVNALLCKEKIPHKLNRGRDNAGSLPRWIADVFWDYCKDDMTKEDFIERFEYRVYLKSHSNNNAEEMWEKLHKLSVINETDENRKNDASRISLRNLFRQLSVASMIPKEIYEESPNLVVSTIHKAKGSEFEDVLLCDYSIKNDKESAEEARIGYVAFTRAKRNFYVLKECQTLYFKNISSGRTIKLGYPNNYYNKKNNNCDSIPIGFADDIDSSSFVSGDFSSVVDLQEYISESIKIFDKIKIEKEDVSKYAIKHQGRTLGYLSKNAVDDIRTGVNATSEHIMPEYLEDVYVSDITTNILKNFNEGMPKEFQKSLVCYGIEITGLAKLRKENKD